MEYFYIIICLAIFGLCMGSFAGATVWRLRARQLVYDKKHHLDEVDEHELESLKKLTKNNLLNDRSVCLHCSYSLKWYDLIPIFSWVTLGGKCRNCRKPIGYMEPLIEIIMSLVFVLSFILWPYDLSSILEVVRFSIWLISLIGLGILFAYDYKWFLLPDVISFIVIGLGIVNSVITVIFSTDFASSIYSVLGSIMILSGLYFSIYIVSKGKWIGFGDIKLGLGLGLLLADWRLAFIALFAANLVGCLIIMPGLLSGKIKRNSRVPFGPLLIVGYLIAGLFGGTIVNLYFSALI